MENNELEVLKKALEREKSARKQAELILEQKSRNLLLISRELKLANQELTKLLNEKSTQLSGVFKNINDAYVVFNLSGDILEMNNNAKELFNHYSDSTLNIKKLVHKKDLEYSNQFFKQLEEIGSFTNFTSRIVTSTKSTKWVQINASLIYSQSKKNTWSSRYC